MSTIQTPFSTAYLENVNGWPSMYTFIPDGLVSLNNRFYTFRDGRIWEHNVVPSATNPRNTFYGDTFTSDTNTPSNSRPSFVEFILNDIPEITKEWRTLGYVGEGDWDARIATNDESTVIDDTAIPREYTTAATIAPPDPSQTVDINRFVSKEGNFSATVSGVNPTTASVSLESETVKGLGPATFDSGTNTVTFALPVTTQLGVDDYIYYFDNTGTAEAPVYASTTSLAGVVQSISNDRTAVVLDVVNFSNGDTISPVPTTPSTNDFFLYGKDRISNDKGVKGNFAIVRMTNTDNTEHAEIFSVNTGAILSPRN
ncbi:MAG: hypothetical protein MPJ25_00890 [Pirellulales bacterium]|nr:hypothetical protein [Pirellulales bacterium]